MGHNELAPRGHSCYANGDLGAYLKMDSLSTPQAHYLPSLGVKVFPGATVLQPGVAVDVN